MPGRQATSLTWVNIIATVAVLFTMAGGAWLLFQSQFSSLEGKLIAADGSINDKISQLRNLVEHNQEESVFRHEHEEFVKRVDERFKSLADRVSAIEGTRPTTGELQALGTSTARDLAEIKERLRALEMQRQVPPK